MEAGQTFDSWSEFMKCKEAFSKATSIQFCTVASHSVNSANEKIVPMKKSRSGRPDNPSTNLNKN